MTAAERVARALKGTRKAGGGFMVRCPVHADRTPSLSVDDGDDGRLLVRCFAGCNGADVLAELRRRGLLPERDGRSPRGQTTSRGGHVVDRQVEIEPDPHALEIWGASAPISGSPAERYLRGRGITIPLPPSLRCHYGLKHGPTGLVLPALVAAVQAPDRRTVAVHRTFLRADGEKKAPVSPKMALGPIRGGAVRLAAAETTLALTEGVEDALALRQMTGRPCWAVLGTSGFQNFAPPDGVRSIILAPDADKAGDDAVTRAAERFANMGLKVLHLRPPEGADWCDVLIDFEERAAIREFDGGAARADAEIAAFAELIGGEVRGA